MGEGERNRKMGRLIRGKKGAGDKDNEETEGGGFETLIAEGREEEEETEAHREREANVTPCFLHATRY